MSRDVIYYNNDGEYRYKRKNQSDSSIAKEIKDIKKLHGLKYVAVVYDDDKGQYTIDNFTIADMDRDKLMKKHLKNR